MKVKSNNISNPPDHVAEPSNQEIELEDEEVFKDPILQEGGVKIYPFYPLTLSSIGDDIIDRIENFFYPNYMYADPNDQKHMNDLLDLASADLPILMDETYMANRKQYYIDIHENLTQAVQLNDIYLNFAKEDFFSPVKNREGAVQEDQ